ncbi:hypothetical protein QCA50_000705 [Cerrena zonata]|uniref:Methionine aminopeptidase n=1 Tax=Cerrena zonata TaxID=2478898 RepID=A0AAW0GYE1_9APHY
MRVIQQLATTSLKRLYALGTYYNVSPTRLPRRHISVSTGMAPPELEHQVAHDESEEIVIQDLGQYDIIMPEEPYQWGVAHITPLEVPTEIPRPPYVKQVLECLRLGKDPSYVGESYDADGDGRIHLGTDEELFLRKAARLAKQVLKYAGTLVKPGITTAAIDTAVHRYIVSHKAYPSPLHYAGFPKSCCTSVNNIVTHGIPDDRPLQDGDIVNIDITIYLNGYHGDTSRTFLVGDVDEIGRSLVSVTESALSEAIRTCGPGRPFKGIAAAIHKTIQKHGGGIWSVSPQFTGHGIGRLFHRPPWVLHDLNEEPEVMLPGHCFTIEPCIVVGTNPQTWIFPDGWTASTVNAARSAQAEDMVLITETGIEVLTVD